MIIDVAVCSTPGLSPGERRSSGGVVLPDQGRPSAMAHDLGRIEAAFAEAAATLGAFTREERRLFPANYPDS